MRNRPWGIHYSNGDLVLALIDGEPSVVVVTNHSGDYHHQFVYVTIQYDCDTPSDQDHLVSQPDKQYSGYYIGPRIGHLNISEIMSLAGGIDVPKLMINVPVRDLIHLVNGRPQPVLSRAAS